MGLRDASVSLAVKGTLTAALDLTTVTAPVAYGAALTYAEGTGAGQVDKMFSDSRQLAASANEDLDLAGVLLDPFGVAITFARVKLICVKAAATNTNNVVVGAAAATQFVGPFGAATHTVHVRPGGMLLMACSDATGWTVGAGASDFLRIANSAGGSVVNYDIIIIGCSA